LLERDDLLCDNAKSGAPWETPPREREETP
jgi:hypothetical protein